MSATPNTVAHVDLDRYLGTWFEICRLPLKWEPDGARDVTATYSLNDDGTIRVDNRCLDEDGKPTQAIGQAKPVDDSNARLTVSFLPEYLRWIPFTKGDYWILRVDADYQTALVGDPERKYLWLLHRQPKMDDATRMAWLDVARAQGYALDDLIHPQQSGQVHREAGQR